jgi:hypothetical protein
VDGRPKLPNGSAFDEVSKDFGGFINLYNLMANEDI